MTSPRVTGSYLLRFTETRERHPSITLLDLRSGERIEFETWAAAWAFLDRARWRDAAGTGQREDR